MGYLATVFQAPFRSALRARRVIFLSDEKLGLKKASDFGGHGFHSPSNGTIQLSAQKWYHPHPKN